MRRIVLTAMALGLVIILGLNLCHNIETLQAKEQDSSIGVMNVLQEVIDNQQKILQKLDQMMEELRVIKIRATHK